MTSRSPSVVLPICGKKLNRIDFRAGRVTIAELADRYLATVQHLAPSPLCIKRIITARIKSDWPGGAHQDVRDVRESHLKSWLGIQAQRMGKSGYNAYVQHARAVFRLALADRLIGDSPAASVKQVKRDKPTRQTPTLQEFQSILDDIRQQKFNRHAQDTADFVEFLGLAGVGNGEAASVKWSDVDFEAGRIRLYRHKTDTLVGLWICGIGLGRYAEWAFPGMLVAFAMVFLSSIIVWRWDHRLCYYELVFCLIAFLLGGFVYPIMNSSREASINYAKTEV